MNNPIHPQWTGLVVDGKLPLLKWLGGHESGGAFLTERPGPGLERAVIHLIPADAADAEGRRKLWAAAQGLDHPHLLRLYEHGQCRIDEGVFFYAVTEYSEDSLAGMLQKRPLRLEEIREMLGQLVDALDFLHARGLVHGGVKPSDVMKTGGQWKLPVDHLLTADSAGAVRGLGEYDAPELESGVIAPSADVWSLGMTLVEALQPGRSKEMDSVHGEPVIPEGLPHPFDGIVRECLRADKTWRCSLRGIEIRLDHKALAVSAEKAAFHGKVAERRESRREMALVAAATVMLAMLLVLGLLPQGSRTVSAATRKAASHPVATQANPAKP